MADAIEEGYVFFSVKKERVGNRLISHVFCPCDRRGARTEITRVSPSFFAPVVFIGKLNGQSWRVGRALALRTPQLPDRDAQKTTLKIKYSKKILVTSLK